MAAAVPALGLGVALSAWGGGAGEALLALAVGVPLTVVLLAVMGTPVRSVVPLCASASGRIAWAVLVFLLGTAGAITGVAAYGSDVDLGGAGMRFALTGLPYAVAAAFFVPSRWVRSGAVAAMAAGVVYGGFLGPSQAEQRRLTAEIASYRERSELLYLGATPAGMQVARAELGPGYFTVDYRPARPHQLGHAGLTISRPPTPTPVCPEILGERETCAVDADGVLRAVGSLPGGSRNITLVRHERGVEFRVESQFLGERALRQLLDSPHALTDEELAGLIQEKPIERTF
ncbi:hypothetical protein [Streptomyces mesophilus]|uniref:hypothetical protein n=1 Tax=Streptomyces mesophilus TaxID=1775132 RepID=UPI00332FEE88